MHSANNAPEADQKRKILLSADGEVSRKDIRLIKQRFQNLHKLRLQRVKESISPRQHIFLDLLPLLFHVNHPILPGYLSSMVPAGIPDYTPSNFTLNRAKTLGKGFLYRKRALRVYPIEGIYLMGSVGSIAHSSKSDLDIWLCHSTHLSAPAIESLQEKATLIEKWAASFDLEVHFFLMDVIKFREGETAPMSSESSGSTQHKLLLEEFYRTALYIAGRFPAWWVVPPAEERQYTEFLDRLISMRFIDAADIIDFGGLEEVPAKEFLGASLWHLYKAIDSPYKSLLKLYLMETYVEQFPDSHWAALEIKRALYDGQTDANQLDAYVVLYRLIEKHFLENNQTERLELMRYCFYNKVHESRRMSHAGNSPWRSEALDAIVTEWGRLDGFLQDMMHAKVRDIHHLQEERARLTRELTHSYRLLTRFAHDHVQLDVAEDEELRLLGRKLRASLEKRPGKIDRLSSRPGQVKVEATLQIKQIDMTGKQGWTLFKQDGNGHHVLLRRAYCILDLLAWALDMGIVDSKTAIALDPGNSQMTAREIQQTLRLVRQFYQRIASKENTLDAFRQPPQLTQGCIVLNSGTDPLSQFSEQGVHLTSERSDSLSYGAQRKNLLQSIDLLYCTSWNEVIVQRYSGDEALLESLRLILEAQIATPAQAAPQLDIHCFSSPRASSIAHRIRNLLDHVSQSFQNNRNHDAPRYVLRIGRSHYLLQMQGNKLHYWRADDAATLLDELAQPQTAYSPVGFEPEALEQSPLSTLYQHSRADRIQVFYQIKGNQADVYVLDERGSLHHRRDAFQSLTGLLTPYSEIIESSRLHRQMLQGDETTATTEVDYFQLSQTGPTWQVHTADPVAPALFQGIDVRIVYDEQSDSNVIYCNEEEFNSLEFGDAVFTEAARYIREQRQSKSDYPVYITDIDVPASVMGAEQVANLQTIHYLQYKEKIEARLNL